MGGGLQPDAINKGEACAMDVGCGGTEGRYGRHGERRPSEEIPQARRAAVALAAAATAARAAPGQSEPLDEREHRLGRVPTWSGVG